MAWAGAIAGAILSYEGAQSANDAAKGAGNVDVNHFVNPYPGSEIYRNAGAAAAYNQMFGSGRFDTTAPQGAPGTTSRNGGTYTPRYPGDGSGGGGSAAGGPDGPPGLPTKAASNGVPAGYRVNKAGQTVRAKNGGGGGGGAAKAPGFQGQSSQTASAVDNALRVAGDMEKSPVTTSAQNYSAATLGGGEDPNAYRSETADMLRNMDDSDYRRYLDALFNADTGIDTKDGSAEGGSQPATWSPYVAYGQAGYSGAANAAGAGGTGGYGGEGDPTGSLAAIKGVLAGQDTPGAAAMRTRIKNAADEAYNEQLRQRRLEASGSGMYGGGGQMADEAYATGKYGAGLADAYAAQDYQMYLQAMGLGEDYSKNLNDNSTSRSNAALSAGTSSANNAAAIASNERLARLDALGNAIGMGNQRQQFQVSGMGSLAEGMSGDQRNALNGAGATNALGQQGWLNAGGLSLGSDQSRDSWTSANNQLRAAQIAGGNQRAALDWQKYTYNREAPMRDIAQYQAIIAGTYDPYASTWDTGSDRRSQSPSYVNPAAQGLAGAAAGYSLGSSIYNSYNSGGGGGGGMTAYGGG